MISNTKDVKLLCSDCGVELSDDNWAPSRRKIKSRICRMCASARSGEWNRAHPEKHKASWLRYRQKSGAPTMRENTQCPMYLGVHVAERILSKVFKNVERMPVNNIGYDFVCSRDKLIDVKAATASKRGGWTFHIRENKIADYFLCLAFDNRNDLTPMHLWLVPGRVLNNKITTSISPSTVSKWSDYELPVNKVATCCDTIR